MESAADLVAAREAFARRDWSNARDRFAGADAHGLLSGDDLVALSDAAFWSGDLPGALEAVQRAHASFDTRGEPAWAADLALVTGRLFAMQGDLAVAAGWFERARRHLADVPECSAHAHLAYMEAYSLLLSKDYAQIAVAALEVEAIATRVGDRDHTVLAQALQGFAAVHAGERTGGLRLLDEALATATSGDLGLFASAEVFCEMVVASLAIADHERASQWMDEADRTDRIVCFPGCCRVHRTTVMRHRGEWGNARTSATTARAEVRGVEAFHEGMALTEMGELHRYKGELALAEQAFSGSYEKGWAPQPGLALVLLARDDAAGAARMIARAVESSDQELSALVSLLPAEVEIAIATGDLDVAEAAGQRLSTVASQLCTNAAVAADACVAGILMRERGDVSGAARELERGVRHWHAAGDPYEVARTRVQLASVLEALGDTTSARLELSAARAAFEELGAAPDAAAAARRLGDDRTTHATRTFMFTDIVNSTELLTTLGDEAWHGVLQWHDRTATSIVADHQGEIVKDTGDGFFVAFVDATMAVDCAVSLQRALHAHRRAEGFAPEVRIGLHLGSAVVTGADYFGRDVVIAARIGAAAGSGEILISGGLADRVQAHVLISGRDPRVLKGITETVEVAVVDWR